MIRDLKNHVKPGSIFWLVSYYPWLLKVGYWLKAKQRSRRQIDTHLPKKKKKNTAFLSVWSFSMGPILGEANNSNLWQFCGISPYNTAFVWVGNIMTAVWVGCFWMAKNQARNRPGYLDQDGIKWIRYTWEARGTQMGTQQRCWDFGAKMAIWTKKKKHGAEACPAVEEDTDVQVFCLRQAGRFWRWCFGFGVCGRFELICYNSF